MNNLSLFSNNQTCAVIHVLDEPIIVQDDVSSDPMYHLDNLNISDHQNWPLKLQTFFGCHVLFVCLWGLLLLIFTSYRVHEHKEEEEEEEDYEFVAQPVLRQPDTPVTSSLSEIEEVMEEEDTTNDSTDASPIANDTVDGPVHESDGERVESFVPFVPRRSMRIAQQRRKQQAAVLDAVNAFIDNAIDSRKIE